MKNSDEGEFFVTRMRPIRGLAFVTFSASSVHRFLDQLHFDIQEDKKNPVVKRDLIIKNFRTYFDRIMVPSFISYFPGPILNAFGLRVPLAPVALWPAE